MLSRIGIFTVLFISLPIITSVTIESENNSTSFLSARFFYSLNASEQDKRNDKTLIYQKPHEVILESDIKLDSLDENSKIESIHKLLQKYYVQFIDQKRIWQDRTDGMEYNIRLEYNSIRLLTRKKNTAMAETGLIRDSPLLFNLYNQLAELYSKKGNNEKAISSYLASLAYRNLGSTENYYIDSDRLNEVNAAEKSEAENYANLLKNVHQSTIELKQEKDKIFILDSLLARGKINQQDYSNQITQTQNKINTLNNEVGLLKNDLAIARKERYEPFAAKKNQTDSLLLFNLAKLVRGIEDNNKERLKVIDKSVYGKGIYILYDYKKNINFPGYLGFLEIAHRINPANTEIILAIAKEYQSISKYETSIHYYKKYINSVVTSSAMKDACFNIARMYSVEKKYSLAGEFYERSLTLADDKDKPEIYFEIADFLENHTGNLTKAKENYSKWLSTINQPLPESSFYESLNLEKKKFKSHMGIASFFKYKKKWDQEENSLTNAFTIFNDLKKKINSAENSISSLKKEVIAFKGNLLNSSDPEKLAKFRDLERNLDDKKIELNMINTVFNSIHKTDLLIRLALVAERKKDLDQSIKYYQNIVESGNEHEINIALKNIARLESIKETGI